MTQFQITYTKTGRQNAIQQGRAETFDATIYPTYSEAQAAYSTYMSVPNPIQTGVRIRVDKNRNQYTESAGSGVVNQNAAMHSIDAIKISKTNRGSTVA